MELLRGEAVGQERNIPRCRPGPQPDDQGKDDQRHAQGQAGKPVGLRAILGQVAGIDGDEGGRERPFSEELAEHVGDEEGDDIGIVGGTCPESVGDCHVAEEPEGPTEGRRGGDD